MPGLPIGPRPAATRLRQPFCANPATRRVSACRACFTILRPFCAGIWTKYWRWKTPKTACARNTAVGSFLRPCKRHRIPSTASGSPKPWSAPEPTPSAWRNTSGATAFGPWTVFAGPAKAMAAHGNPLARNGASTRKASPSRNCGAKPVPSIVGSGGAWLIGPAAYRHGKVLL